MCWQGCKDIGTLVHCWWKLKTAQLLAVLQKVKHRIAVLYDSTCMSYPEQGNS